MIEVSNPSIAAATILDYALKGRILDGIACTTDPESPMLRLLFDSELAVWIDPLAVQTQSNPVPWFTLKQEPKGDVLLSPHPDEEVPSRNGRASGPLASHAGLSTANTIVDALGKCGESRVYHVMCDMEAYRDENAARHFQFEFERGFLLTFDFNPEGLRMWGNDWVAVVADRKAN